MFKIFGISLGELVRFSGVSSSRLSKHRVNDFLSAKRWSLKLGLAIS